MALAFHRKSLQIFECLLFETDDLIMRKNEKHVILCLLEVARRGAKFGEYFFGFGSDARRHTPLIKHTNKHYRHAGSDARPDGTTD